METEKEFNQSEINKEYPQEQGKYCKLNKVAEKGIKRINTRLYTYRNIPGSQHDRFEKEVFGMGFTKSFLVLYKARGIGCTGRIEFTRDGLTTEFAIYYEVLVSLIVFFVVVWQPV